MKLSIIVITYNHEKYIRQALDSILMQQVDFEYEVIILEDCSTDKTRDIALGYRKKFNNIHYFFNKRNHGAGFTLRAGIKSAKGQYCCVLEGDDYWIASNKLQQQIHCLDERPSFVGCAHNTEVYYQKDNKREKILQGKTINTEITIINLIDGSAYFHTTSYVWRNIFKDSYPKAYYYNTTLMGDWFLSMLYAQYGKIYYIDQVMSCYRFTGTGVWSKLSEHQRLFNNIRGMYLYDKLLNYKYAQQFTRIWWACDEVIQIIKKERGSKLLCIQLWFLKNSVDVRANNYTRIWGENIKIFTDKYSITNYHGVIPLHKTYTLLKKKSYIAMRLSGMSKVYTLLKKLLNFVAKCIQFPCSNKHKIIQENYIDNFLMKNCELIFQAFFKSQLA